jgi:hypothetical protein
MFQTVVIIKKKTKVGIFVIGKQQPQIILMNWNGMKRKDILRNKVKNMTTKKLEQILFHHLQKQGTYMCFEVMIPSNTRERVDCLSYDTKDTWRFYELKVSVADFHSNAKVSFYGNFNYYVMPEEVYNKVKDEIPPGIGVYIAWDNNACRCEKKAEKREITHPNKSSFLFALMQALYRDYSKIFLGKRWNVNKRTVELSFNEYWKYQEYLREKGGIDFETIESISHEEK